MGLFDGVGGPLGGTMPLGTMTPMGVATSMGAAASAVGVPGFSMMPPTFPLIAGMGWSSRSSYAGHPEFRGVADMSIGSNNLQRGWAPGVGLGAGLGTFLGAPPIGSGGYYIGPGPQFFDPMAMFAWMYQQTFGPAQQPAGPAQAAAPQPAQVNAKGEEPKADESGKGGKPVRRGGGGVRAKSLNPGEAARLQELEAKKRNPLPFIGGLNDAEQREYDALKRRSGSTSTSRSSGSGPTATGGASDAAASAGGGAERLMSDADKQRLFEIIKKTEKTAEDRAFIEKMKREHPSVFKK